MLPMFIIAVLLLMTITMLRRSEPVVWTPQLVAGTALAVLGALLVPVGVYFCLQR